MKVLKLINNERKTLFVRSTKACDYDSCNVDRCDELDYAYCTGGSSDTCKYDRASCTNGIDDTCAGETIDFIGCATQEDVPYN